MEICLYIPSKLFTDMHGCVLPVVVSICTISGVDLSKILGWKKVSIIDEIISVSQLLGAHAWAPPKSTPMCRGS